MLFLCSENVEKQIAALNLEQRIEARFDTLDARFDKLEHDSEKRHHEWVSYRSLEARMNKVERVLETSRPAQPIGG